MPNTRLPMRHAKEVLRLKHEAGFSERRIAKSLGISRHTVGDYLARAERAGITDPLPPDLTEADLEKRLFPPPPPVIGPRPRPDGEHIHNELRQHKKVNLTLSQLWLEYKEQHPEGYQYTQFCEYYRRWLNKKDFVLRQDHKPGEKLFVDYTDGPALVDVHTGELVPTHLFVAVWGASTFTYVEASLSQNLPAWTSAHAHAFAYFGCVPRLLVPDNLKSGVHHASFYEPLLNPTYQDLAEHYSTAILPTRPAKPRDKAKVENGVLIAQRWLLAVLRHQAFHTLGDLNAALSPLLEKLNHRLLHKAQKSRRLLFEELDRPAALALPSAPYVFAEWIKATVHIDYHIEIARHYYSVPCRLIHEIVEVRLTPSTLEVFFKGERVAAHPRAFVTGRHTTDPAHMPPAHRFYTEWSPERFRRWAAQVGPCAVQLIETILASRPHPEQAYRSSLGLLHLAKSVGHDRFEAAAQRALTYHLTSFRAVKNILANGLDKNPPLPSPPALPLHGNIRGGEYYKNGKELPHVA